MKFVINQLIIIVKKNALFEYNIFKNTQSTLIINYSIIIQMEREIFFLNSNVKIVKLILFLSRLIKLFIYYIVLE